VARPGDYTEVYRVGQTLAELTDGHPEVFLTIEETRWPSLRSLEARRRRQRPCAQHRALLRRLPQCLVDILSEPTEDFPPLPRHPAGSREDANAGPHGALLSSAVTPLSSGFTEQFNRV
jgi:hypothetical protein